MRLTVLIAIFTMLFVGGRPSPVKGESIDGRVTQIELPPEDVNLIYVERRGGFTVKIETDSASVEGQKFYIGDGEIAIDLVAHPSKGIFLQGMKCRQRFGKGAPVNVRPGYKKATALRPGDIYVILPAVLFKLPKK